DNLKGMMDRLGLDDDMPIESKMITRAVESAQKRVEGNNFDARKTILSYDDVLREQREVIYEQRYEVITAENGIRPIIEQMIESVVNRVIETHISDEDEEANNYAAVIEHVHGNLREKEDRSLADIENKDIESMKAIIMEGVATRYDEKEEQLTEEQMREFEKVIVLRTVDTKWMDHIDQMDQLRQGIHLRAYAQNDPLREYQMEGFNMFETMIQNVEEEIARYIMKAQIESNLQREQVAKNTKAVSGGSGEGEQAQRKPYVRKERVGRNDPCPCGSGKKYKNCHGKA